MPRVIHFEIGAQDPERANKFYQDVFDWKINKWEGPEPYWIISTGDSEQPGIDGALMNARDDWPRVVNTIDVPNLDEYIDKIKNNGGSVVAPKMTVPNVGYVAYCADTEGNIFGIIEEDPEAKE